MTALVSFNAQQLRTIRTTVARDTNEKEFDLFMNACRSYGLDPFRKQISAIVFNKDKPDKRQMAIIVGRDGLRSIAQKCGDYRPQSSPAVFEYDAGLKGPTNPKGIATVTVTLYKQDSKGEWYPVVGQVDWDEFVPLKEIWETPENGGRAQPSGKFYPLSKNDNWCKMPKIMIAKCAEAQALRAGWPDEFGGIYVEEEMQAAQMKDITPSEAVKEEEEAARQAMLGNRSIMFTFGDNTPFERVPLGGVADRCIDFIGGQDQETVYRWAEQNREPLRDFWAASPTDALALKKQVEAKLNGFNPANGDAA